MNVYVLRDTVTNRWWGEDTLQDRRENAAEFNSAEEAENVRIQFRGWHQPPIDGSDKWYKVQLEIEYEPHHCHNHRRG